MAGFALPVRALVPLPPANAEDTLEWVVADSDLIVRGVARPVTQYPVSGRTRLYGVQLMVIETIKGKAGPVVSFVFESDEAVIEGNEYLVFLTGKDRFLKQRFVDTQRLAIYRQYDFVAGWKGNDMTICVGGNGFISDLNWNRIGRAQLTGAVRREVVEAPSSNFGMLEVQIDPESECFPTDLPKGNRRINILVDTRAELKAKTMGDV